MSQKTDQYYVRMGTQLLGPLTVDQLRSLKDRGRLQSFHSISTDGKTWQPASSLMELFPEESDPGSYGAFKAQSTPTTPVVSASQEGWYYLDANENQVGPVSEARLVELFHSKEITNETLVWKPGIDSWRRAGEVLDFSAKARCEEGSTGRLLLPKHQLSWVSVAALLLGVLGVVVACYLLAVAQGERKKLKDFNRRQGN